MVCTGLTLPSRRHVTRYVPRYKIYRATPPALSVLYYGSGILAQVDLRLYVHLIMADDSNSLQSTS